VYPILVELGSYQLRAYGVVVALAILTGIWFAAREARRKGLDSAVITDAAWPIILAALVGARLYYVVFHDPAGYLVRPLEIVAVWHGGLSVHGALLGGLLAAVWSIRRHRLAFWRFADVVAPGVILGQTVGQIACLLNGDSGDPPMVAGVVVPPAASALLVVAAASLWWWRRTASLEEASSVSRRVETVGLVLGTVSLLLVGGASAVRAAAPAAPELGRPAPDFTLPDLAGKLVRLAAFQGKKVVLINFWATWCPPCREEMPTLERLARLHRDALEVLGVNIDSSGPAKVRAFVRELGISFPILLDPDLAVGKLYRLRGLPSSFVIDREGIVRFREIGFRDWTDAESQFVLDQALRPR